MHSAKFLVFWVTKSPKVFEKEYPAVGADWVRCTDFTSDSSIGQSFAYCLQFPTPVFTDQVRKRCNKKFSEHKRCSFELRRGNCYTSRANKLAPVIDSPSGIDLTFETLFKLNSLVQNGTLLGPALSIDFFKLVNSTQKDMKFLDASFRKLGLSECYCYDPFAWLQQEKLDWVDNKGVDGPSLEDNFYIHQVKVTPTKVYFRGPELKDSNRVLRQFSNHLNNFLSLSFVDEDFNKLRSLDLCARSKATTKLYDRINSVLRDGVVIGNKLFEFLAFSNSQLRETSLWMFSESDDGVTSASIRDWMGDFQSIRNVAKYAARLGQCFSSSVETEDVTTEEIELIPDVEIISSAGTLYVFSDGIGKISAEFAEIVAKKCGLNDLIPSVFQIRYAGYKGVVAIDTNLSKKLSLRNSMKKFDSNCTSFDVLAWSKYQPCFLNRQLITLLSTLGVKDEVFLTKQREVVEQFSSLFTGDPIEALDSVAPGWDTIVLRQLILSGYKPDTEPFLSMMFQYFIKNRLFELRKKSRISIQLGRTLIGCLDETRTLEYGQVFVQCSDPTSESKSCSIIEGPVVVAKMPCLHPGDIRVLQCTNVPTLHHLVDCVVFPQKGSRPHPNECSGSDLDGDTYFVSWDMDLIPPDTFEPMDYTPEEAQNLDHDVTIEEIKDYFTDFILDDTLGTIANSHLVHADREEDKAFSEKCIRLARLFSTAVDSPKTGAKVEFPRELYVKVYPDFMEKPGMSYVSTNVIGQLFREIQNLPPPIPMNSSTGDAASDFCDEDMVVTGFEDYVENAMRYKERYRSKLRHLMDLYGIKTEAEILARSMEPFTKTGETVGSEVRSLIKEVSSSWFKEYAEEEEAKAASAWYQVTYNRRYCEVDDYLSFPWCIYSVLLSIKKEKMESRIRDR
ncbi:PREDICTED: RNA-dependent RNA polymerase 1-like [Camelina sativa]|uniref:RNA-dependent RNA polymerase n=1 Tax=Camelina sativa TaxID=90675 RepID=A0ABM0XRF0_CAMSA|nr:PREDICTED: RNA-dependent RNA polymerase 1-like [Camelina sativa]